MEIFSFTILGNRNFGASLSTQEWMKTGALDQLFPLLDYDQLNSEKTIRRLVARLGRFGVEVTMHPKVANAAFLILVRNRWPRHFNGCALRGKWI